MALFGQLVLLALLQSTPPGSAASEWEIPKHIFHFGKQEYLLEDALIDTVPREAWDMYIMGDHTANQLPRARRGLYGGININYISDFTPNCGEGEVPWFMVVHVADQCRGSEVVGDFRDILTSPQFKNWFEGTWVPGNPGTPLDTFDAFIESAVDHRRPYGMFRIRYHQRFRINGANAHTELHEEILQAWIEHNGYKVMFNDLGRNDTPQDSQWYIRDLDCIEKIDGTPAEVLDWISQRSDFWRNYRSYGRQKRWADFDSPVIIFLKALADVSPLDSGHVAALGRIKSIINLGDTPIEEDLRVPLDDLLAGLSECEGREGLAEVLQEKVDHYMASCRPLLDLDGLNKEVINLCRQH